MESNPQSSGICHRLFRLVVKALRRPSALPPPPVAQVKNGKNSSSSEIVVELRHTDAAKEGLILSDDQNKKIQYEERERDHAQGKGKKGSVSINGSERKEVAIHSATMEDDDETKTKRHWPLLGVASNINEKSEAFIERKKKAMTRNYSLDQDRRK